MGVNPAQSSNLRFAWDNPIFSVMLQECNNYVDGASVHVYGMALGVGNIAQNSGTYTKVGNNYIDSAEHWRDIRKCPTVDVAEGSY